MDNNEIKLGLSFVNWLFESEKKEYILYKNKELDDVSESKKFDMKIYELLEKNGYEVDNIDTFLFKELISSVNDELSKHNNLDINVLRQSLVNKSSYIYYGIWDYLEISNESLQHHLEKINSYTKDNDLKYEDKALLYALYLSNKNKIKNDTVKTYVNTLND